MTSFNERSNMDVKVGLFYADDKVLQQPQVSQIEGFLSLNGLPALIKNRVSPQDLQNAGSHCATEEYSSFSHVFEIAVKDGTSFKYLKTPSARLIMMALMETSHASGKMW